ncbi:hypothetical protein MC7420_7464 [Coleofasciculus chthonoplastes PCC 7420]|uniref:DUF3084 domain-containing protein n=1 Tax=Coleofasciculus chthonoplastes PCC 7420 TaxID=118168 RepID=B4VHY9_9CYAN|nr:DUF3084 domain-containing protein [Coleofasciculus chthonoplastes]EDX78811.1 hypothetical protein MC7420_7464 [Coleofasciculus chthonoplastes PCC 7420]
MTSAYILIVAILLLGGVLATLGDRIGTKVGKARLSLFNLRPRKTATVVTIMTGCLISASTLGILFGLSESLREGVFQLDNILRQLRHARRDVEVVNAQKQQVEGELAKTRAEQAKVQQRLDELNSNFQKAQAQLRDISKQASNLRSEIQSLLAERGQLIEQRNQLRADISQLKELVAQRDQELEETSQQLALKNQELEQRNQQLREKEQELAQKDNVIETMAEREARLQEAIAQREARLQELQAELQEAIAQREVRLAQLEEELAQRELLIAQRNKQLQEQEQQLAFLERQVDILEQYYQNYQALRQGNVAILRGQVLAFGVVRIVEPSAASEAVDQLLREANRTATEIILPGSEEPKEPLIQITKAQAEQLIEQIQDGEDYVVRILSAGNYVVGEKPIQAFADAALNQMVFEPGEVLAAVSIDTSTLTNKALQQRIDQLLAASQFRARRAGVLGLIQVADGDPSTLIRFIEQLAESEQPLAVRAIAQDQTSTAGPLKMQLVAIQNGQIVFST